MGQTHYDVLGVAIDATLQEIRDAYRVKAQLVHPDRHSDASASVLEAARAEFAKVAEAYEVLSDDARRTIYDADLRGHPNAGSDASGEVDDDDLNPEAWTFYAAVANVEQALTDEGRADKSLYAGLITTVNQALAGRLSRTDPQPEVQAAIAVAYDAARDAACEPVEESRFDRLVADLIWGCAVDLWQALDDRHRRGRQAPPSRPAPSPAESAAAATQTRHASGTASVALTGGCEVCGEDETFVYSFHDLRGRILWLTHRNVKGRFCGSCAQALGRACQTSTLNQGWWGVFSFLATPFVVLLNASALHQARRRHPGRGGLDPGVPVHRRPMWGFIAAVVVIGGGAAWYAANPPVSWKVGACVDQRGSYFEPVPCSRPHDGSVVSTSKGACPTDYYVTDKGTNYCISLG